MPPELIQTIDLRADTINVNFGQYSIPGMLVRRYLKFSNKPQVLKELALNMKKASTCLVLHCMLSYSFNS